MHFSGEPDFQNAHSLKSFIAQFEAEQNAQFFDVKIEQLQRQRAEFFDHILTQLWRQQGLENKTGISINAVGGYGRKTLHPKSDIDICILLDTTPSKDLEIQLSAFLTQLWDLGVDIGHAVRTEQECLLSINQDITIATNLLDIRTLSGSKAHAYSVLTKLYSDSIICSQTFFSEKITEQTLRHEKANNTALYLEPNIKNNPGGMRDVQTIIWLARKHFKVADVDSLKSLGFLQADEYYELIESYHFVCRMRWALHCVAKRPLEVLLFDYQLDVAQFMKFGQGENAQLAVEKMMRQLFRAMTRIRELNQMMIGVIKREIYHPHHSPTTQMDIDDHFFVTENQIQAKHDAVFFDKTHVLTLFRLVAEQDSILDIAPETLRLLRQTRRSLLGELQDYQGCRSELLKIIKHPNGLKRSFSLMHRYGVLASYFPEWRAIEGQMQFDMHNAYTMDEHAFKFIQYIDQFADKSHNKNLINSIYKAHAFKHILVFAGLCHDLSGQQGHQSNEMSALFAKEFALLHDFKRSEVELIQWLIENQHLLVNTVQTLDVQDPEVVKSVAKQVRTETKLNALYCFTVADLKATNDQSWNEWQESILNELYFAIRNALKNGIENVFEQRVVIRENKTEALQILNSIGFTQTEVNQLWTSIPSSFFSANQVNEIVEFTTQILTQEDPDNVISLSEDTHLECTNLLVFSADRSMLFVDLFNSLSALKINVKEAQLHQTKNGKVLEIIKILDHNDEPVNCSQRSQKIIKRIQKVLIGCDTLQKPHQPKQLKNFENAPEVEFLPSPKSNKTLLKVHALDNPLFIEKICDVFKEKKLTIHSAKISSLGESSENVFSISAKNQSELSSKDKMELAAMLVNTIS